jgi:hypothetical protein
MRAPFGISGSNKFENPQPSKTVIAAAAKVQAALKILPVDEGIGQRNSPTKKSRLNALTGVSLASHAQDAEKRSIPNALLARQHRDHEREEANSTEQHNRIKRAGGFLR